MTKLTQLQDQLKEAELKKYEGLTVMERYEGFQLVRDLTKQIETELKKVN